MRSGLSPGEDEHLRGDVDADPEGLPECGGDLGRQPVEEPVMGLDLLVEVLPAAGEGLQSVLGGSERRVDLPGSQAGAAVTELRLGERLQLVAQLIRSGDHERLERDDCLGSALHGGVPHDLDLADHLAGAIRCLRDSGSGPSEHGTSGVFCVDRVALASLASIAAIRASGLDDALVVAAQEPYESLTVGATALDSEAPRLPERPRPGEQLLVATGVCRDGQISESLAGLRQSDRDMDVLVSIDSDRHLLVCHSLHGCPLVDGGHTLSTGRAGGQERLSRSA
jgi:hypothetical protein